MNTNSVSGRNRRTLLRWLAPLVALLVFAGGGAAVAALTSAANADLPPRSAATLLTDIGKARLTGLSGTVVQNADLGLPALPANLGPAGGGSTSPASLLSGSHTLRVWYAGPERARLSLLGDYGESDLVKNGRSVWLWSSQDKSAKHWLLPRHAGKDSDRGPTDPADVPMTPQQAADAALKAISPTTKVTAGGTATVAGRSAYLLTLAPRSAATLIDSVQIAVDGETHVPTRVRVYAEDHQKPVFEVGFTDFDPGTPPASVFAFNPPPGTKVTEESLDSLVQGAEQHREQVLAREQASEPEVVGSGWSSVMVLPASKQTRKLTSGHGELAGVLDKLQKVSGTWGSGRLLTGTAFSVLVTDNGRVALGAVPAQQLYDALGSR